MSTKNTQVSKPKKTKKKEQNGKKTKTKTIRTTRVAWVACYYFLLLLLLKNYPEETMLNVTFDTKVKTFSK